jgi:hypothetical protein
MDSHGEMILYWIRKIVYYYGMLVQQQQELERRFEIFDYRYPFVLLFTQADFEAPHSATDIFK